MKNKILTLLCTCPVILNATAANAEDAENINEVSFKEVTVVATKTEQNVQDVPQMVTVIDAEQAGLNGVSTVSELLRNEPAVNFAGGPVRSGQTPNMRGFDSTSLLITLDGRRQQFESAHDGNFFIDPSLLKRVDVVRGPASAIYGAGGLGGVIAFETKDAADFLRPGETEGVELRFGGQSVNEEGFATVSTYKIVDDFDLVASLTARSSEDIELSNDTTQRSDDRIVSGLAKLTYNIDEDSELKFAINSFINNATENTNPQAPLSASSGLNLVDKRIHQNEASIKYNTNPSDEVDLRTHLYVNNTRVKERIVQASGLTPAGDILERELTTIGLNIDNTTKFYEDETGSNHLTYGIEAFTTDQKGSDNDSDTNNGLNPGQRAGVPNAEQVVLGAYVQDEMKFNFDENFSLYINPSARLDYYKNEADDPTLPDLEETKITPRIGSTLELFKNYNIFGSYSQGFRSPNLTELYAQGVHFPQGPFFNTFLPNPNLQPEESETYEIGTGFDFTDLFENKDSLRFKASRYWTEAENYIEQRIAGLNTQFINVPEASIWGYESNLTYENQLLRSSIGASYVSAKDANAGISLSTRQALIFTSDNSINIPQTNFTVGHFGRYSDGNEKGFFDTSQDLRNSGFAIHGLYARYNPEKVDNLTLDFAIDNIFDKQYIDTFSQIYAPGTNFRLSATLKW